MEKNSYENAACGKFGEAKFTEVAGAHPQIQCCQFVGCNLLCSF